MIPSLPSSTLLDRMVARVAEPAPAIAFALPGPAAWGEEVREPVALAPARVPEVETFTPKRQDAPTIEDGPPLARGVREEPAVASVRPPVVQPAVPALFTSPHSVKDPDTPLVEAPRRTEVVLHETTTLIPGPPPKLSSPPAFSRETRAITPRNLPPGPVLWLRDKQTDKTDLPTTAAAPPRKAGPPVVQPDLPVALPIRESAPLAASPSEPVIHVTIGRLEVRAPERERKPRPAERRSANAGPSLEQYLTKRRGGGPA